MADRAIHVASGAWVLAFQGRRHDDEAIEVAALRDELLDLGHPELAVVLDPILLILTLAQLSHYFPPHIHATTHIVIIF